MFAHLSRTIPELRPLRRYLNLALIEHQSKALLAENNCTVPNFCLVTTSNGNFEEINKITAPEYAIKAQIVSGDRGRGIFTSGFRGGIHLTRSRHEAIEIAQRMLGQVLVTSHTGSNGAFVDKVLIGDSVQPFKSKYLCFNLDMINGPEVIVSDKINQDYETVYADKDKEVFQMELKSELCEEVVKKTTNALNFGKIFDKNVANEIRNLWKVFVKYHMLQLAVNPLVLSNTGHIVCLDADITIDNNAKMLPHIASLVPLADKNVNKLLASINYVNLDGNIGCLVNGAGLALHTNDLLVAYGGKPGNFLNLNFNMNFYSAMGGNEENLRAALDALISNVRITSVLLNVNWHSDCTMIAKAIIESKLKAPIVMRLKGVHDDAAWKLLDAAGSWLKVYRVNDTEEAVRKVIVLADVSETLRG